MATVDELHSMAEEMMQVLHSDTKELDGMGEIAAGLEKWKEIRDEQENQIKKDIAALIALKDDAEENAAIGQSDVTYHNELQQVSDRLEQAKAHKENVNRDCEEVKARVEELKSEEEKIQRERDIVKKQTTETLPNTRYNVSLYSNITNIRWQYDCEPSIIKGYVSNKNDVKPFSLDSKEYSQYFTVNYLWDIMETDW